MKIGKTKKDTGYCDMYTLAAQRLRHNQLNNSRCRVMTLWRRLWLGIGHNSNTSNNKITSWDGVRSTVRSTIIHLGTTAGTKLLAAAAVVVVLVVVVVAVVVAAAAAVVVVVVVVSVVIVGTWELSLECSCVLRRQSAEQDVSCESECGSRGHWRKCGRLVRLCTCHSKL
jgi:hypothetical protein